MGEQERAIYYQEGKRDYSIYYKNPITGEPQGLSFITLMQPLSLMVAMTVDYIDLVERFFTNPDEAVDIDGSGFLASLFTLINTTASPFGVWNPSPGMYPGVEEARVGPETIVQIPAHAVGEQTFFSGMEALKALLEGDFVKARQQLLRTLSMLFPLGAVGIARGLATGLDQGIMRQYTILVAKKTREEMGFWEDTFSGFKPAFVANVPPNPFGVPARDTLLPIMSIWGDIISSAPGVISRMLDSIEAYDLYAPPTLYPHTKVRIDPPPPWVGHVTDALFDITSIKDLSKDPAEIELGRVQKAMLRLPVELRTLVGFGDLDVVLHWIGEIGNERYIEYVQRSGALSKEWIRQDMQTIEYKSLQEHESAENWRTRGTWLSDLRRNARQKIRIEMFGKEMHQKMIEGQKELDKILKIP
jgi:hypothetical protein